MSSFARFRWPLAAGVVVPALLVVTPFTPPVRARGDEKQAPATARPISYLREVRPILAQHCFQCHGPDEAARKGKLRLDLKDAALAERKGRHVRGECHDRQYQRTRSEEPLGEEERPHGETSLGRQRRIDFSLNAGSGPRPC